MRLLSYTLSGFLFIPTTVLAQAGTLDPAFGTAGVVRADAGASDILRDVTVQSDGKIVATGWSYTDVTTDLLVARFNSDGTPDNSFSGDGHVILPTGSGYSGAEAVDVLANGKILVAGYSNNGTMNGFTVWRFLADGTLDEGFGSNGTYTGFGLAAGGSFITDMTVQPDGRIVVVGPIYDAEHSAVGLVRLTANGTLDNTFNGTGLLRYPTTTPAADHTPNALQLLDDGRMVVGGSTNANGDFDVLVMRATTAGTWDNTFDSDGLRVIDHAGQDEYAYNLTVRTDGRYVLTGETLFNNTYDLLFAQVDANGTNSLFSGTNMWSVNNGASEYGRGAALQPDDKLVVAGSSATVAGANGVLFRTGPLNGSEGGDGGFGSFGWVVGDFGDWTYVEALCLQPDGKVIIAGNTASGGAPYDMMLARYDLGLTTSIAEEDQATSLSLYPQPNDGSFTVRGTHGDQRLVLFDAQGRIVQAQRAEEGATVLNTGLSAGPYMIQLRSPSAQRTLRFIVH